MKTTCMKYHATKEKVGAMAKPHKQHNTTELLAETRLRSPHQPPLTIDPSHDERPEKE